MMSRAGAHWPATSPARRLSRLSRPHYGQVFSELGGTIEVVEFHNMLVGAEHAVSLVKERAVRRERCREFNRVVYPLPDGKVP
jgi:hypothetical protein